MSGTHEELMRALGQEIQAWRKKRSLTREQLAEMADISVTTMGRIERDGPADVSVTWRLADALDIGFADLVRRAEEAVALAEARRNPDVYLPGEQMSLLGPQPGEQMQIGDAVDVGLRRAARRGVNKGKQRRAAIDDAGEESQDPGGA